jgi:hypothetical protein
MAGADVITGKVPETDPTIKCTSKNAAASLAKRVKPASTTNRVLTL